MPRVSVLTPIYNTNPVYLKECIESVLNQTFSDFEFIILNDSPDNLELDKIVTSYKDKRIKYVKNDDNMGISFSRNKLLSMACGEYLAIFDHDDVSLPNRLSEQVAFLDSNREVGLVSGQFQVIGGRNNGKIIPAPEHDVDIKIYLTDNNCVSHSASMIRKSVLVENNIEYEELYSPAEDYRLCARLMDVTSFHNLKNVLIKYRCYPDNTTNLQSDKMHRAWQKVHLDICNKYPAHWEYFKCNYSPNTRFRLRLFDIIPLIKIKNNTIFLFEYIPILKIKRK